MGLTSLSVYDVTCVAKKVGVVAAASGLRGMGSETVSDVRPSSYFLIASIAKNILFSFSSLDDYARDDLRNCFELEFFERARDRKSVV